MIDMSVLTKALKAQLDANATLVTAGCEIERSTRINFDPARCPWLGIYPGDVDTKPRTAIGRAWDNDVELQVVVQTASLSTDGTAASDELEVLIAAVLAAVNVTDLSLGVTGLRLLSSSREYRYVLFDSDGMGDLFMPQAIIKLMFNVRTQ